jgi:hypothetical protein
MVSAWRVRMNDQQRTQFIAQLRSFRRGRPCNAVIERSACERVWFLRRELPSKSEAVTSIESYLSSLPPGDMRRENAQTSLATYRGELEWIRDELAAREEVLFDVCSCKCQ